MKLYFLFLLMATTTVLSPGPGVVMTLSNALRFGLRGTVGGIVGIAVGAMLVAAISATSLGILLASSALAFTAMKYLGAAYLFYLAIRLWRAPPFSFTASTTHEAGFGRRLLEGLSLQLTNPKAIFFFLSVFPQFINPAQPYTRQFVTLVCTYSMLVMVIHFGYALCARRAKHWLQSVRGGRMLSKLSAGSYVFFGISLASTQR